MPRYGYACPNCNCNLDIIKPMAEFDTQEICAICGTIMERDFNQHGIHCGNKTYGNPLISESLGIHPEQAAEHRKNHPNVEVIPMGQLKFNNYQDHKNYLNKIAWDKKESRRKRKI